MREIAPECVPLFVQSAGQLAVAYKRCSEMHDQQGADAVLHMMMNYPDQTLRVGTTAQQKQWLSEAATQVAEVLPSIVPAPAAIATAPADAADADTPPVAVAAPAPETVCPSAPLAPLTATSAKVSRPALDRLTRAVRRARKTVRIGGPHALSRAAKCLGQAEMAPMTDDTRAKLRALHPQAAEPLPPLPADRAPGVLVLNQLEKVLKQRVHNGSAPGPSG
jgi:hypothetical protein